MKSKQFLNVALAAVMVAIVAISGIGVGWEIWGRHVWADIGQVGAWQEPSSTAGRGTQALQGALAPSEAGAELTAYLAASGYPGLRITEVLEFQYCYYAIAQEPQSGHAAMELIVDKATGLVAPERGPNMMWNDRYGMMMTPGSEANTLTTEDAQAAAQRWLSEYRPGWTTGSVLGEFYGYYTFLAVDGGQIKGLISVGGSTGQAWYHTWLGEYVSRAAPNSVGN